MSLYKNPVGKIIKLTEDAVFPTKAHYSDVGFDLHIIGVDKKIGEYTTMYKTGITAIPPQGYYFKIVPRSSIIKTGYILANSMGIIDPEYRGELKVVLTKVEPTFNDIAIPSSPVQLILEKHIQCTMELADKRRITATERGEGGFGSSNKQCDVRNVIQEIEEMIEQDDIPNLIKIIQD